MIRRQRVTLHLTEKRILSRLQRGLQDLRNWFVGSLTGAEQCAPRVADAQGSVYYCTCHRDVYLFILSVVRKFLNSVMHMTHLHEGDLMIEGVASYNCYL